MQVFHHKKIILSLVEAVECSVEKYSEGEAEGEVNGDEITQF